MVVWYGRITSTAENASSVAAISRSVVPRAPEAAELDLVPDRRDVTIRSRPSLMRRGPA